MRTLISILVAVVALSAARASQTWVGTITDEMCEKADHSQMRMGPTDAECTLACVNDHGVAYVLYDGKATYRLSDQRMPEPFAGKKVRVTGTLDEKTKAIHIESIRAVQ